MRKLLVIGPVLAVAAALAAAPADAKPGKRKAKGHSIAKVYGDGPPYGRACGYRNVSPHRTTNSSTTTTIILRDRRY
jgi:hypothetical protein